MYFSTASAIGTRSSYRTPIAHCPPLAFSWWWLSTVIPHSIIASIISLRRSWTPSVGGHGKYPCRYGTLYPRFGRSSRPVFHSPSPLSTW